MRPVAAFADRRSGSTPTLLSSLVLNARIIGALMIREGSSRYGHENLGFFWIIGEPLFLTIGVMVLWTIGGNTHGHSIGVVPFALSGYTMLTLWRHLTGKFVHAIRNNGGLMFHRNIRVFDVLLAKGLLEIIGIMAAFFIAWCPLALLGYMPQMTDPLIFVGAYLLHAWFSFAFGCVVAALSELWEPVEQFLPPILYLTLPLTGAFSMAAWLPQTWREILLWSPLANTQEMLRAGMFPPDTVTYWDATYVVLWCVGLSALAFPLVRQAQRQVSFS
jgi:capsular polysaccharide transport system permease protein